MRRRSRVTTKGAFFFLLYEQVFWCVACKRVRKRCRELLKITVAAVSFLRASNKLFERNMDHKKFQTRKGRRGLLEERQSCHLKAVFSFVLKPKYSVFEITGAMTKLFCTSIFISSEKKKLLIKICTVITPFRERV